MLKPPQISGYMLWTCQIFWLRQFDSLSPFINPTMQGLMVFLRVFCPLLLSARNVLNPRGFLVLPSTQIPEADRLMTRQRE